MGKTISQDASKLLRFVRDHEQGSMTLEEFAKAVRMSRAACHRLLRELEQAGAVSLHIEED